jgi:hypothetical protein
MEDFAPPVRTRIRTKYQRASAAVRIAKRLHDRTRDPQVREGCAAIVTLLAAPIEHVRAIEADLVKLAGLELGT